MESHKPKLPFIKSNWLLHCCFRFHSDAPERVTLITNLSISHKVCAGMVATFTCAVEASNPAVKTFTLLGNGSVVSNKRDSGVWIRTLTTGGDARYKCTANNSVGVSSSDYINFTVEGEGTDVFE